MSAPKPTFWRGVGITGEVRPEPLWRSLLAYRSGQDRDRLPCTCATVLDHRGAWQHTPDCPADEHDLVGGRWEDGLYRLQVDVDVPHVLAPSSTPGHAHLTLLTPIPRWRWVIAMIGLRAAGLETGFVAWSLRRGTTFLRSPDRPKLRVDTAA